MGPGAGARSHRFLGRPMNMFDAMEDALLEASRIQREELSRLGLCLADLVPEEVADLRRFLRAQGRRPIEKEPING